MEGVQRPEVQIALALPMSAFDSYVFTARVKGIHILKLLIMLDIARLIISRFDDSRLPWSGPEPYDGAIRRASES